MFLPGSGLSGRGRAVHCDWSGEVNQTAGATETSARGPRERDVGILEERHTGRGGATTSASVMRSRSKHFGDEDVEPSSSSAHVVSLSLASSCGCMWVCLVPDRSRMCW